MINSTHLPHYRNLEFSRQGACIEKVWPKAVCIPDFDLCADPEEEEPEEVTFVGSSTVTYRAVARCEHGGAWHCERVDDPGS